MDASVSSQADRVAAVRRFNRFYTRYLGVLRDGWLDSPFSLTEARVLYELHQRGTATATEIGRELDVDAGYLSRIVRRFTKLGLIARKTSATDARQSLLSLTPRGKAAYAPLEAATKRDIGAMLGRLDDPERARLISAMHAIEELVAPGPQSRSEVILRAPQPGDLGWVVARHATLYRQEYDWVENFEGVCAQIVADFAASHDPARERCWIADLDGAPVGSVFLVKETDAVARLRLLLVDPASRGRGVGTRLTDECIRFARANGYRSITLWTHSVLTAARKIYRNAGFTLTASERMKNFGKSVVSETWELTL